VPTRANFETLNALIAEAAALCEAAQSEFERIHEEIQKTIDQGRTLNDTMISQENRARAQLFLARTRLSRRRGRLH
jgi:hypothetical protein